MKRPIPLLYADDDVRINMSRDVDIISDKHQTYKDRTSLKILSALPMFANLLFLSRQPLHFPSSGVTAAS